MLFKKFVKYQSLGNDFIIFDWQKKPSLYLQQAINGADWQAFIRKSCHRQYGVGADGVLIITHNRDHQVPEVLIFNADGSSAQTCLNGLRCVAHYLFSQYRYPNNFTVKMGSRLMSCMVNQDAVSGDITAIKTHIGTVEILGEKKIETGDDLFSGYCTQVGNPHFIIFEKREMSWLKKHGALIESHQSFPDKTNVEFIWEDDASSPDSKIFNLLVYERGCGVTLACGSGVAAVAGLLVFLGKIRPREQVVFVMPGGSLKAMVDDDNSIGLQAQAQPIFDGSLI